MVRVPPEGLRASAFLARTMPPRHASKARPPSARSVNHGLMGRYAACSSDCATWIEAGRLQMIDPVPKPQPIAQGEDMSAHYIQPQWEVQG
jgi:hypothetical protein